MLKEDVVKFVAMRQAVEEEARMEGEALEGPENEDARVQVGMGRLVEAASLVQENRGERIEISAQPRAGVPTGPASLPLGHLKDVEIAIRGYRRAMVKAMAAATSIPHFNFMDEFDVTSLSGLLSRLNGSSSTAKSAQKEPESKLTNLSFLVKALSLALTKFPTLNATVDPDVTTIRCHGAHNIGIAMATPHGLVVPNIKNCERLSISEVAAEIVRLRQLAAANQLPPADLAGGTITISNIGAVGGGTYACPLVFQPQMAIVALGRVRQLPRFDEEGEVCAAAIMNVSWAADHRVVDGATLAGLSMEWQHLVENPERLLLSLK